MKIYTKAGDKGKTRLYDNQIIEKDHIRVESYGSIDELNCNIGMAKNFIEDDGINEILLSIQLDLFNVAGELATRDSSKFKSKIEEKDVERLENIIDDVLSKLNQEQQSKFIVPGTNKASGQLHISRTICRRCERIIIKLSKIEDINEPLMKYVNRLSDVLYSIARYLETEIKYVDFSK